MYERILFVCTGNTCRSPMAEGLFRKLAEREGLKMEVRSAGVAAWNGSPISKHSADILQEKGITDKLTSSAVTEDTVAWADLILTMTMGHKQQLIRRYPEAVDIAYTLKEFAEDDPAVTEAIARRQKLHTELQIKQALGEPVTKAEQEELQQAEAGLPGFDIADPYGGDRRTYQRSADEIEAYLMKLIRKLSQM
ncbi:low molecular weight protein arginine phosphatase [Paenibacillus ginsengarvi]|uniref:Low molecular weight protein arginine phosphatase n=1 Tax=Paenibacillus ginsengarvi TaxID=400777 RepID=A0A3B0BYU6_9BACL|nr:low molecular weight protein arginine phosphatase [Paenibacillus ginsengarvi]RKN78823.1 low molecular weight protein arginine phosphatase [Paenibacillus ginsengarvi]